MKKHTVDRFEGNKAVLLLREDETIQVDVKKEQLPKDLHEGDILNISFLENNDVSNVEVLKNETEIASDRIKKLQKKILNKDRS